jgi:hypothetical protein
VILVLADSTDPWATLVHRELSGRGKEVSWIQPTQLLDRVLLNWPVISGSPIVQGILLIDGHPIALADLTGILVRLTLPLPLELNDLPSKDRDYVIKETTAAWLALLNAMPCAVVNKPVPGGRPTLLTGSPLLSQLVQQYGFSLPPSRCTSSRADAIMQFSAWGKRVWLKPLGSLEPGMALQPQDGVEQIVRVMEHQAVSMQMIPEGQRITVYVVGDKAAATIVQADESQDRSADFPSLPTRQCVSLAHALGLTFAECQVIVTPEGHRYCLDVSGAPSYWRCPQQVQQQIVGRLADYLSEPRSLPFHDSLDGADGGPGARQRLCQTGGPER